MNRRFLIPAEQTRGCTRRHAIKVFGACVGGAVLGRRIPRALADLPWGDDPVAALLGPDGKPLALAPRQSYGKAPRQNHPTLVLEPSGARLWTSWTQLSDGREAVLLRSFSVRDAEWGAALEASPPDDRPGELAHESELAVVGNRLLVVWSRVGSDGWAIRARAFSPASQEFGPVRHVAGGTDGEFHAHPAIAAAGDHALVVWQAKRRGQKTQAVLGRLLDADGQPLGDTVELAADAERDCCHPAVAAAPDGRQLAVVFDRQDAPGTQNVYLVLVHAASAKCEPPRPVSNHPASDVAPAVAYSPDGEWLWVAWHSNRKGEVGWDIPKWYRVAALRVAENTWHAPDDSVDPPYLDQAGTVQGFELVRLVVSPRGVVSVLGRASQNFYVQYYTAKGRSPLYRLPEDGWGGRGRLLRGAFDGDGALWVTRRDLGTNVLNRINGFADLSGPPPLDLHVELELPRQRRLAGCARRYDWLRSPEPAKDLNVYFGDIHGHTWQSDGMGDPEESYLRARDVFRDDFHVVTDHDNFVDKRLTDAQWAEQKALAEHYHAAGSFVTLFGHEWTTPRITSPHGWGHCNIYTADPTVPLFDHADQRYRDLPDLYAALRPYKALAIPHHIGWTGVRWDALDAELTPVVEVCSIHGAYEYEGNEPIRHRGGIRGSFLRDGLAAGRRVGVVAGSDQHGLIWHHGVGWKRDEYRGGLTGIWAPELTRDAVLAALRARRTFATSGIKLWLFFAVGDALMGTTMTTEKPPTVVAEVAIPPAEGRLEWLEVVRDGVTIRRCGPEGPRTRLAITDDDCPASGTACYYARVKLAEGNLAWSSPVWVTRRS